jgi:hypothetical protein
MLTFDSVSMRMVQTASDAGTTPLCRHRVGWVGGWAGGRACGLVGGRGGAEEGGGGERQVIWQGGSRHTPACTLGGRPPSRALKSGGLPKIHVFGRLNCNGIYRLCLYLYPYNQAGTHLAGSPGGGMGSGRKAARGS